MTEIDLKDILSNNDNSREPAPRLQGLGFGVVEPVEGTDKPSLFAMALGNSDDQGWYCKLLDQYEESLTDLAESIQLQGQLQNCRVRILGDGKYALTFGARRCLAILYLHAKHGTPAVVMATISKTDHQAALIESAAENIHLPPSYIDQARLFKRLREQGLEVKEIAKVFPMGRATEQNIRHRLRLLELPPEVQLKVHHGKLSQEAALNLLKKNLEVEGSPDKHLPLEYHDGEARTDESGEDVQRADEANRKEKAVAGKDAELQAILQKFISRLGAFDLDAFSPVNPDELLRLTRKASGMVSAVKKKLSTVQLALVA